MSSPSKPPSASSAAMPRRAALAGLAAAAVAPSLTGGPSGAEADDVHPDAELLRVCAAYEALEHEYLAAFKATADDNEGNEITASYAEQQEPLLGPLLEARATTMAGVIARARLIVLTNPDLIWTLEQPDEAYPGELMVAALLRDLAGDMLRFRLRPCDGGELPAVVA